MTDLYNVLDKLRASDALTEKEEQIHEQGLVSVLCAFHNDLDCAVAAAFGPDVALFAPSLGRCSCASPLVAAI